MVLAGGKVAWSGECDDAPTDRDPFAGDGPALKRTEVLMTVLRGEIVHDRLTFGQARSAAAV